MSVLFCNHTFIFHSTSNPFALLSLTTTKRNKSNNKAKSCCAFLASFASIHFNKNTKGKRKKNRNAYYVPMPLLTFRTLSPYHKHSVCYKKPSSGGVVVVAVWSVYLFIKYNALLLYLRRSSHFSHKWKPQFPASAHFPHFFRALELTVWHFDTMRLPREFFFLHG